LLVAGCEGGKGDVGLFPRPLGERVRVRGARGRGGEKIPLTPALSPEGQEQTWQGAGNTERPTITQVRSWLLDCQGTGILEPIGQACGDSFIFPMSLHSHRRTECASHIEEGAI
jgi:hypothetical protein